MRSVHTAGSTQPQPDRISPACLDRRAVTAAGVPSHNVSFNASTFLQPFAPRALPRFIANMTALTPDGLHPRRQVSLIHASSPVLRSVANHLTRPNIALTRYPSACWASFMTSTTSFKREMSCRHSGLGFAFARQARRNVRPNRVRHPTDRGFTSDCFGPRLTTTPLSSVTGRRASAWRGLAPL